MVQAVSKAHMRAMAAAGVLFVMNLGGLGLGPTIIGFMNDLLAPRFGIEAIRVSMLIIGLPHIVAAVFGLMSARTLREDIAIGAELIQGVSGASPLEGVDVVHHQTLVHLPVQVLRSPHTAQDLGKVVDLRLQRRLRVAAHGFVEVHEERIVCRPRSCRG